MSIALGLVRDRVCDGGNPPSGVRGVVVRESSYWTGSLTRPCRRSLTGWERERSLPARYLADPTVPARGGGQPRRPQTSGPRRPAQLEAVRGAGDRGVFPVHGVLCPMSGVSKQRRAQLGGVRKSSWDGYWATRVRACHLCLWNRGLIIWSLRLCQGS